MINPRRLGHLLGRVSRFHSFWPIIKNYAIELLHVEPLRWLKYNRLGKPSWPTQLHKKLSLGARWSAGVSGPQWLIPRGGETATHRFDDE